MLVTALLVFVLPTSLRCVGASGVKCHQYSTKNLSDDDKCVAKDILWGWLNVTNKCNVRALEVLKNVTELRKRGKEVETEADKVIAEYKDLLGAVGIRAEGYVTFNIKKAFEKAQNAIAQVKKSYTNASTAEQAANNSKEGVFNSFDAIIRASRVVSGYSCSTAVNYTGTKEVLEMNKTESCNDTAKYNVSARLSSYAEQLDEAKNLTEWKEGLVNLFDQQRRYIKTDSYKGSRWAINKKTYKKWCRLFEI
ncbi:hypothetical protein ERJ75_000411400 [Trypanosoma vivax]|uniref:Uncharacterized protein n=1 Tax=Trypanosoma vivax (strain Y486) TaxID=1055687 RepID=F9WVW1_TRYVY|nr:hypothetical protein TRVL_09617 [Trypanosoma vivax]KAH8617097.1 hypothetical protein ERJ75_000411400 [Trypanosoma vivax]CCD21723.1 hypothetical protein, conserved in T. vivax [Trypanosoma vivax Y486]|eukprot:CCD21723.1 hypothetical protein, conserved in T. vivax [Trypanosoma vivax Y486]